MFVITVLMCLNQAPAQQGRPDPDIVPSAGIATEGGPGALWVNPANMVYDPDPRWGLFARYGGGPDDTPMTLAATAGISGVGAGIRWMRHASGYTDVAVDLAAGVRLPQRVSVGASLHWNIEARQRNFVAFDAAASWRPLPWLGLALVTRNIGSPGELTPAWAATGGGIAIRPLGQALLLGTDFLYTFGPEPEVVGSFNARVRPTRGMYLRAKVDTRRFFGAGVEFYFGSVGVGAHAYVDDLHQTPDIVGWIGSDERREHVAPPRRRVNALELNRAPEYQPTSRLLRRPDPSWLDTLEEFRRVAEDPSVQGMVLTVGDVPLDWAQWQELRAQISLVCDAGKKVMVYLVGTPSNGTVYAAAAATDVIAHPAAVLQFTGLSIELVHLHGLLDAVGVDVDVVRRSEFKAAAEPFTRVEPSAAQRRQQQELLDDLYARLIEDVAAGRNRSLTDVAAWADGGPYTAAEAELLGLVDGRAYPDQLEDRLTKLFDGPMHRVQLSKQRTNRSAWDPPAEIATIYVEGPLVSGESSESLLGGKQAGAETIRKQLERAARNGNVRAIVLRIDSPGGSTYAAEALWRAVQRVKAAGKPVVVSMGGMAASGGYYVASGADAIWAEPATITGSIGVIAVKPSFARLADLVGVRATQLTRGRNAGMDSMYRGWDPVQRDRMQHIVDDAYETFKDRVAVGRNMSAAQVEAVARGRVWSGTRALELGLVDRVGGLPEALDHARKLAGIGSRYPVSYVTQAERRTLLDLLAPGLTSRATSPAASALLDSTGLRTWTSMWALTLNDTSGLWMIDPWWMTIKPR